MRPSVLAVGLSIPYFRLWKDDAEKLLQTAAAEEDNVITLPDGSEWELTELALDAGSSSWPGLSTAASNLKRELFGTGYLGSSNMIIHVPTSLVTYRSLMISFAPCSRTPSFT